MKDRLQDDFRSGRKVRLFLSYSRKQMEWAESLVTGIERKHGDQINCRFDKRDLPYGEKWKHEIEEMIRWADAVVFVISPDSIESKWCQWEMSLVAEHSKRLIPIQILEIDEKLGLPPAIGDVQIIPAVAIPVDDGLLETLTNTVLSDRSWIITHTRLAEQAAAWAGDGSKDRLLRGNALRHAEAWRESRPARAPEPSKEQLAFILASQAAAKQRSRLTTGVLASVAIAMLGLALWANGQRLEARKQEGIAQKETKIAEDKTIVAERQTAAASAAARAEAEARVDAEEKTARAQKAEASAIKQQSIAEAETVRARSNEYAARSRALVEDDPRAALLLAVEATRSRVSESPEPLAEETVFAAARRIRGIPLPGYQAFGEHYASVESVAVSANERLLAMGGSDGTVHIWDVDNRANPKLKSVVPPLPGRWQRFGGVRNAPIELVSLSRNGDRLAVVTTAGESESRLRVIDTAKEGVESWTGKADRWRDLAGAVAEPDGGILALLDRGRSSIQLLDLNDSSPLSFKFLRRGAAEVAAMSFSSDGSLFAALDKRGRLSVYDPTTGQISATLELRPLNAIPSAWDDALAFKKSFPVTSVRLSSDGRYLAVLARLPSERTQPQQMGEVWDLSQTPPAVVMSFPRTKEEFGDFDRGNGNLVTAIEFSPNGHMMAIAHNREVRLWDLTRQLSPTATARTITLNSEYTSMVFSADGRLLALGDIGGTVSTIETDGTEARKPVVVTSKDSKSSINTLAFSRSGSFLVAGDSGNIAWLLDKSVRDQSPTFATLAISAPISDASVSCPPNFVFQRSMVSIETGRMKSAEDSEAGVHG